MTFNCFPLSTHFASDNAEVQRDWGTFRKWYPVVSLPKLFTNYGRIFVHSCPPVPVSDKSGKKYISKGEEGFEKALCVSDDDSHSVNIWVPTKCQVLC